MSAPDVPLVIAVVLAYDGQELTSDCLGSLGTCDWPRLEVVVVDNGSGDGTAELVAERFPDVTLIRSERNLGFAGGVNLGLERALQDGCDFALVLNNDTLVEPTAVSALVAAARANPRTGALSPLVTYAEPADVIWYAGADYDPRRGYPGRMRHYRETLGAVRPPAGLTDRFTGAAVLLRRLAIEQVGMFDESLFFLYEDVDLSLRLRDAGWQVCVAPDAVVRHRVAMAQGGEHSPTSFYYGVRNQLVVGARHVPLGGLADLRRTVTAVAVHLVRVRRARNRRAAVGAVFAGLRDHRRGRLGPRG